MNRLVRSLIAWTTAPSSNRDALAVLLLGWLFFGGGIAVILGIDLGFELSASVAVALTLIAFAIGSVLTLCATWKYQRCRERDLAALESDGEEGVLSQTDVLRVYVEYQWLLSEGPLDLDQALAGMGEAVSRGTGSRVHVSLLRQQAGVAGGKLWEPVFCPTHSPREADAFRVPVDGSYLAHKQSLCPPGEVFGEKNIEGITEPGYPEEPDLRAFLGLGYRSFLCCPLATEVDGERVVGRNGPCLLMLSNAPYALGEVEGLFLRLLAATVGGCFTPRLAGGGASFS